MKAKLLLGSATLLLASSFVSSARADEPDPCAQLEASYKTDRAEETLEALAKCREKEGKVAQAWGWYSDLVSRAVQTGQAEREKQMRDKVAELEKKIPHVTLKLTGRDEVTQIRIDGQPLGRPAWSTPLALDPGAHVFWFGGPGRENAERRIMLKESETLELEPPLLVDPAKAQPAYGVPPPPPPMVIDPAWVVREDFSAQRRWGKISLVAGGVGLVLGGVFGVMALSAKSDADDLFSRGDAGFKAKDEDASTNAAVSTVGFGIGLVGAALGTYLLVTAKSDRPNRGLVWPTTNGVAGRF